MKWSKITWKESEPVYTRIISMPFIRGLIDGTLPPEKFKFYIGQDSNYLEHFGRALSLIASRVPASYMLDYIRFSEGAIVVENALHSGYFEQYGMVSSVAISPACQYYTSFLLSNASLAPVETAMAALLPCFWIYKKVGDYIYSLSDNEDNPYHTWINTYAGEEFGILVEKAIHICDQVAEECTASRREEMTRAFLTASRLEWLFWDSAWRLETWDNMMDR